jgi:hypothetical protein
MKSTARPMKPAERYESFQCDLQRLHSFNRMALAHDRFAALDDTDIPSNIPRSISSERLSKMIAFQVGSAVMTARLVMMGQTGELSVGKRTCVEKHPHALAVECECNWKYVRKCIPSPQKCGRPPRTVGDSAPSAWRGIHSGNLAEPGSAAVGECSH